MKSIEKDNLASIKQQLMSLASKSRIGGVPNADEHTTRADESPFVYPTMVTDDSDRTLPANRAKPSAPSSYNQFRSSPVKMTLIQPDKENN